MRERILTHLKQSVVAERSDLQDGLDGVVDQLVDLLLLLRF